MQIAENNIGLPVASAFQVHFPHYLEIKCREWIQMTPNQEIELHLYLRKVKNTRKIYRLFERSITFINKIRKKCCHSDLEIQVKVTVSKIANLLIIYMH